ncbi:MAG: glycosyltransferase, partial [Caldilineae bacterium]
MCGRITTKDELAEAGWLAPDVLVRLARRHPHWKREDGACPACVQQVLLQTLLDRGDAALHDGIQAAWPLDARAAFGVLPTPLRLHADPRYTGKGITLALVDSAFYPHPDLVQPRNRIRAWVDAGHTDLRAHVFGPDEMPRWPGWDDAHPAQWHGLMTSGVAAGNGWLSHGLYRGLASDADLVLVQLGSSIGHISNARIARALRWLCEHGQALGVQIVNLSVGGDPVWPLAGNPVDEAVAELVAQGVTVVAAAGNDGERRLIPPATAPAALTIGGLDDKNTFDHNEVELWHSNYGQTAGGALKPELVAPSIWVAAPVLPGSSVAEEAAELFARRAEGDKTVEKRIAELKLVTPHYQHVDGTSFAAPLVASVVACMLEANPALTPHLVRDVLIAAAQPIPGAPIERQGAGALDAGQAVALALREQHGPLAGRPLSPQVTPAGITFLLHDHNARRVEVFGSWNDWRPPPLPQGAACRPVVLHAPTHRGAKGTHVVIEAVRRLREVDGVDFEFQLVENLRHTEARQLYERADLLIDQLYAGWYGGLDVELMALGKPVIAADTEDCRGPVEDGKNGFLTRPRDSVDLADKINRMLSDDRMRTKFGEYSLAKIQCEFD